MADEATQAPAETQGQQQNAGAESAGKTFSQEELDRIVEQRLARTKAQFKDYDDLKKAAERLSELESQNQSEFEKLRTKAERAQQAAQEAADRERHAIERANSTLIRAAVVSEASRQNAVDPDAVYRLLDPSKLTIGDGDQVDGVSDAVAALLDERSYLAGRSTHQGGAFDGGARQSAPSDNSRAQLNDQIRRAAGF